MNASISLDDVIGLAKTEIDVHTLGISTINDFLHECGFKTVLCDSDVAKAFSNPGNCNNSSHISKWIIDNEISVLGFSYRLDPDNGVLIFRQLMYQLKDSKLLRELGGPLKKICFAGLPSASDMVKQIYGNKVDVFYGEETPLECLGLFGIDTSLLPRDISDIHPYDTFLENFGKNCIKNGDYYSVQPIDRNSSKDFGTKEELLSERIKHGLAYNLPPLIRAHAGQYQQNRIQAVKEFTDWARKLAHSGYLDILSIGTSQLTQERFGEEWGESQNGGGVPVNSPSEYERIYIAARPMFVRTYSGTHTIRQLAEIHEETLNIAWHALSLWWFSRLDGRGPNSLYENLKEHFDTIRYIASVGKPYEANVPHHFAFRGSDDITYVVSAFLAAKSAMVSGIRDFILQIMLNVPKYTWGINDLAKARATLKIVKELESKDFRIFLQTRAGLDYLSHNSEKAKMQLASTTALMDDIEPYNTQSPHIIHVVSYSEGNALATTEVIDESIKITRYALDSYRKMKKKGETFNSVENSDIITREQYLLDSAHKIIETIETCIKNPYSPGGLYDIFRMGFMPVPQLRYCRDLFPEAIRWETGIKKGCVDIYDGTRKIAPEDRMEFIREEVAKK